MLEFLVGLVDIPMALAADTLAQFVVHVMPENLAQRSPLV